MVLHPFESGSMIQDGPRKVPAAEDRGMLSVIPGRLLVSSSRLKVEGFKPSVPPAVDPSPAGSSCSWAGGATKALKTLNLIMTEYHSVAEWPHLGIHGPVLL